jgi:tetratricopeptide (TPR) repeat protein
MDTFKKIATFKNEIIILSVALGLRLIFLWALKANYFFYGSPGTDVLYYQSWADRIAFQNLIGTETFWGLPLYPYFLALLKRLTLNHIGIIRVIHLVIGSINCVLLYRLTRKIFSQSVALIAGLLGAAHFTLIFYDWIMMPNPLLVFLSLVIISSLLNIQMIQRAHELIILGALMGLSIVGDGKMLFFTALTLAYFCKLILGQKQKWLITRTLWIFTGVILVVGGVTVRNWFVSGEPIFISAQSGLSFYVGNNARATGYFENPAFIRPTHAGQDVDQKLFAQQITGKRMTDQAVSDFWRQKALTFILSEPLAYVRLLFDKSYLFLTESEYAYDIDLLLIKDFKNIWDFNPYQLLFPLALAGFILSRRCHATAGHFYLAAIVLSQWGITLLFFLTNRHRATMLPFLIIFEAYTLKWLFDQCKEHNYKKVLWLLLGVIAFFWTFQSARVSPRYLSFLRHAKKGPIYEKRHQYTVAVDHYQKALAIRPHDTNTLYNLGNTFFQKGAYAKALLLYQKVIALNPLHIDALYNMAFTYEATNELSKAMDIYQRLLPLDPQSVSVHFRIAGIFQEWDQCAQAASHYKKILQIAPEFAPEVTPRLTHCQP